MVDIPSVPLFPEADEWPVGIHMLQNGWRPTGGPVNPGLDQGLLNWPLAELVGRTRYLRARHDERRLDASITLTVGVGGDCATLNEASDRLSLMSPRAISDGITGTIRLLAGYQMAEQLILRNVNLGWVKIIADDPTTLIRRATLIRPVYLIEADAPLTRYPAFAALEGARLPSIGALFSMTAEGDPANRVGLFVSGVSSAVTLPSCGIESAGAEGALIASGSTLSCEGANFRNAGDIGILATRNSIVAARRVNVSGAKGSAGVAARRSSSADIEEADASGCTTRGVLAQSGARINAQSANCRRGASDSSADIVVAGGGIIVASSGIGGTSIAVNTVTATGVIFK